MLEISLGATIAAVSGPALLTNASALLLGGASNRYHSAIEARRHQGTGLASSLSRRIVLSVAAVHAFHIALIAFAFDCALLLLMTATDSAFRRMGSMLNAGGTALAFVGFAALMAGVVLLAIEGLFGYRAGNSFMLRASRRHAGS
jgi:hypothetical protein